MFVGLRSVMLGLVVHVFRSAVRIFEILNWIE